MKRARWDDEISLEGEGGSSSAAAMIGGRFPWEMSGKNKRTIHSNDVGQAVEEGSGSAWSGSTSDSEEEMESREIASHQLKDLLMKAYVRKEPMNAFLLCQICQHASDAGAIGLEQLMRSASSTHHTTKLDEYLKNECGPHAFEFYSPLVPQTVKTKGKHRVREVLPMDLLPPHQLVGGYNAQEVEEVLANLRSALRHKALPECFWHHPLVIANPTEVSKLVPFYVFMDGVSYAKRQSVLALTFCPVLGGAPRKVSLVLKKSKACCCGCQGGWCTLFTLFQVMRWSLKSLAEGLWPARDHLCNPLEGFHGNMAGQRLPFRGLVLQIRSDWSEYSSHFGLSQWNSKVGPCFLCKCGLSTMLSFDSILESGLTMAGWEVKTHGDFEEACSKCEVLVENYTEKEKEEICAGLKADKRKSGKKGMILSVAIPNLSLTAGLRLEPSAHLPDWSILYSTKPQSILFWQKSLEVGVRHRNPLLDPSLGLIAHCLWRILRTNMFGSTAMHEETRREETLQKLEERLFAWYKGPGKSPTLSKIDALNVRSIGKAEAPCLHYKAAESLGLLRWLNYELPKLSDIELKVEWSKAFSNLVGLWEAMSNFPFVIDAQAQKAKTEPHTITPGDKIRKHSHVQTPFPSRNVEAISCEGQVELP
eukprot:6492702-Amphidinium_carterae.1